MEIKNSFDVVLPPDQAWKILMDIPRIVPCMPGAELVEMVDDKTFKGKVGVKLGPIALVFNGKAEFEEIDDVAHTARAKAQGTDTKGRGGASAVVTFRLTPIPAGSRVDVVTDVALSGSVAQYGRGTGVIQSVASQLISQFAASLNTLLAQTLPAENAGTAAPQPAPTPAAAKPISALGLLYSVIASALANLFKRKPLQ
jgi:carbon monoxide dehydrogenase subunit G